ncbi:hypothetical protein Pst134EB_003954 [Puccinia striiformis f. sp. tritici]|nr:hypothetical protein Pst134EB_003954 [Puccinia striiformis f. sp. tritici]
MSHHKKPIKAGVPKAHLYISDGFLSDNTIPLPAKDEPARTPSRQILHHPFTSQINLLLSNAETPSGKSSPEPVGTQDLVQLLTGVGAYQHFTELNLADLLTDEFAQKYLRSGSLVAMSVSKVIGDDLFAIDGYGTIHMRLCQSTYQTLGLSGPRSKFGPPGQHFVVEIDTRDQAMRSGKAVHERAKKCLHNFPGSIFNELIGPKHESRGRRWDVVMAWVDEQVYSPSMPPCFRLQPPSQRAFRRSANQRKLSITLPGRTPLIVTSIYTTRSEKLSYLRVRITPVQKEEFWLVRLKPPAFSILSN